jgi:uncharacterized protein YjiS (DUF1127 family)
MLGIIGSIFSRMRAWRAREASLANLRWLDDRTLADIGLRRDEIPLLAAGMSFDEAGRRAFAHGVAMDVSAKSDGGAEQISKRPNSAQEQAQMTRTSFHPKNARTALAAAGVMITALSIGAAAALAKDTYPPAWNVKSDVPTSTTSTWIGGYNTNLPYWADHERPDGHIPSRYSPNQCHWDWCKTMIQNPGTATAQVPQPK